MTNVQTESFNQSMFSMASVEFRCLNEPDSQQQKKKKTFQATFKYEQL